jgi:hypothetical protein
MPVSSFHNLNVENLDQSFLVNYMMKCTYNRFHELEDHMATQHEEMADGEWHIFELEEEPSKLELELSVFHMDSNSYILHRRKVGLY